MKRSVVIATSLLTMSFMVGTVGAAEKKKAKETDNSKTVTNSIGMKFVKVPAGGFMMGKRACQQPDDPFASKTAYNSCLSEGSDNEKPSHRVSISQSFLIGQYEVTQEQWYKVMGGNPATFETDKVGEDSRNYPVENVSWDDVQSFISRLNDKEGKQYRLPTEAEWEYACKSGGEDQKYCGGNDLSALAWYAGNSGNHTHRVRTKKPNGLGIYDMSGNVWEWVSDWYGENYYGSSPDSDPQGPYGGEDRVFRGGSWFSLADDAWSSTRYYDSSDPRSDGIGFRLVSP